MAAFAPGTVVLEKNDWPESCGPAHIRTPHNLRRMRGRVVRRLRAFANPRT